MEKMQSYQEFMKTEIHVGTIISAEMFQKARKPAYLLLIDFGDEIGILKSSSQITDHYTPEGLLGRQILAVTNFPPKQIGPIQSQCLVLGTYLPDGSVILMQPESPVANGSRVL